MNEELRKLGIRSAEVASAAEAGAQWLADNEGSIGLPTAGGGAALRRLARRARRLGVATERPVSVAVFGPSQAGKSYLVSSLATPLGKPLTAVFGEERLDFLRQLNPEGGDESTGLVSRFTVRPPSAPTGFPVPLRLFSQTDVFKILANAGLEDLKLDSVPLPEPDDIQRLLKTLQSAAGSGPCDGMVSEDIHEMEEYFDRHFRGHPVIAALGSRYWTELSNLAPRLPLGRRVEALAPLWRDIAPLTNMARELILALGQIGFAELAFCDRSALLPRETGILNAETLFRRNGSNSSTARVVTHNGTSATLQLSHLAGLVAELIIPLPEPGWDYLAHTDLLDFPGARARESFPNTEKLSSDPQLLGRLFLRGKVAYLFQRYNVEQEIASMILCIASGVQEVRTLPEMVATWIDETIGRTPTDRAAQRNSLFFVLTKFDMEIPIKGGEDVASGQKWTIRIQSSLRNLFGAAYDWPTNWSTKELSFKNCFWLRNPTVPCEALFDYDHQDGDPLVRREVPTERGRRLVELRRLPHLQNELVQAHFADPAKAWSEVLEPNDGGIRYLAAALAPVCDLTLKIGQIHGRLNDVEQSVAGLLTPYFHTGDVHKELEQAQGRAKRATERLVRCAQAQRFGALLRALQVTQDEMLAVYLQLQATSDEVPIGVASQAEAWLDLDVSVASTGVPHRFDRLAEMVLERWAQRLQGWADALDTETFFLLDRETAQILTSELQRAAQRTKLKEKIVSTLHADAAYVQKIDMASQKVAMILEEIINNFVFMLAYDRAAPTERPATPRKDRRIFAPRPPVSGLPMLGPRPTPYDQVFQIDWVIALRDTIEQNMRDAGLGGIDVEQNARLGEILQHLAVHH